MKIKWSLNYSQTEGTPPPPQQRNETSLRLHHFAVEVIVRPQSTVEYTSVLTHLIHDRCSSDVEWLCLTGLQRHPYAVCSHSRLFALGWMHSLKREQARCERERVGYESLTHCGLYCADWEKSRSWINGSWPCGNGDGHVSTELLDVEPGQYRDGSPSAVRRLRI